MDWVTTNCENNLRRNGGQFRVKPNNFSNLHALYNDILCGCGVTPVEHVPIENAGPFKAKSYEWSRLGPMGYLVEPKLYPIDVGATPVLPQANPIETKNWQNTIDNKSLSSLNIVPVSPLPPADILRRIDEDRLRSTYQTDFGDMDDYPWADYDNLMVSAGYKNARASEKPREELKCRESVKRPNLSGHEIPGRRRKDSSNFASGNRNFEYKIIKRRSVEPVGTNLPLKSVKPRRAPLHSRNNNHDDDIGGDEEDVKNHQNNRRRISGDSIDNERKQQIVENATVGNRELLAGATGDIKNIVYSKNLNNGRHQSIDRMMSNLERNSLVKRIDKVYKDAKSSRKDITSSSGKTKESGDELQLLSSAPWTSEYQDIISRTADDILRTKLHYYGKLRLITPDPECLENNR